MGGGADDGIDSSGVPGGTPANAGVPAPPSPPSPLAPATAAGAVAAAAAAAAAAAGGRAQSRSQSRTGGRGRGNGRGTGRGNGRGSGRGRWRRGAAGSSQGRPPSAQLGASMHPAAAGGQRSSTGGGAGTPLPPAQAVDSAPHPQPPAASPSVDDPPPPASASTADPQPLPQASRPPRPTRAKRAPTQVSHPVLLLSPLPATSFLLQASPSECMVPFHSLTLCGCPTCLEPPALQFGEFVGRPQSQLACEGAGGGAGGEYSTVR